MLKAKRSSVRASIFTASCFLFETLAFGVVHLAFSFGWLLGLDLSVSQHDPFAAGQFRKANRSAGVEFVC